MVSLPAQAEEAGGGVDLVGHAALIPDHDGIGRDHGPVGVGNALLRFEQKVRPGGRPGKCGRFSGTTCRESVRDVPDGNVVGRLATGRSKCPPDQQFTAC